jgi:hypothetical protein
MAKNNTGRDTAATLWYQQIQGMTVSESVAALKRFLSVFSEGDTVVTARQQLDAQQKQLADPAFRARASGLAAVEAGKGGTAIGALQDAVSKNHQDSEAVGRWDRLIPRRAIAPGRWRSLNGLSPSILTAIIVANGTACLR